jgi:hypothetical protein
MVLIILRMSLDCAQPVIGVLITLKMPKNSMRASSRGCVVWSGGAERSTTST